MKTFLAILDIIEFVYPDGNQDTRVAKHYHVRQGLIRYLNRHNKS